MDETAFRYLKAVIDILDIADQRADTGSILILKLGHERSYFIFPRNIWPKKNEYMEISYPS